MKIAFTGPESSGKTSSALWLAKNYNGIYCEEFAVEYLNSQSGLYLKEDLEQIAIGQKNVWLQNAGNHLLACDTEMTVLKIWSEWKYGSVSDFIQKEYEEQEFDHYFLCAPDIPWEPDPLRESPNDREELFKMYQKELASMNRPYTILIGSENHRQKTISRIIDSLPTKR